jgi:hypothetical protein
MENPNAIDEEIEPMSWSKIVVDDAVLSLWPGVTVRSSDIDGPTGVKAFFMKQFNIDVYPVGCVETLPDVDADGNNIEGTGGRHDFFFFVKSEDVCNFAVKRFAFGMRWWEDVYFNGGEHIYPLAFQEAYPNEL